MAVERYYSREEVERLLREQRRIPGISVIVAVVAIVSGALGFFAGWLMRGTWG